MRTFFIETDGQDLVEYTLLMAFILLAGAAIFIQAGENLEALWGTANGRLVNASSVPVSNP